MLITCRTCMLEQTLPEGVELLTCPACGTSTARPQAQGTALDLLRRATHQRLRCDFHNAENSYQHVLLDAPEEHEALWGLALCRYGVEYVEDPHTGKRLPTVHAVRSVPMQLDSDFQLACEYAPREIRSQYEAEAEYIDNAMASIRELAESCPPYDVFLCHKTTRPGSREYTEDYSRAFKLYHKLDKLGYRVFFAPAEMDGIAGADYEAAIYHALETAGVMLVVCSDADYLMSPWVRSEWKRFLEMMGADMAKRLLPLLYAGMPALKLPRDFRARRLQAVTMDDPDAMQTVLRVLEKVCGSRKPAAKPEVAAGQEASANQEIPVLEKVAAIQEAPSVHETSVVQKVQPVDNQALVYNAAMELLQSGQYAKAQAAFMRIRDYQDSAIWAQTCEAAIADEQYQDALQLMKVRRFEEALAAFARIPDHKDSAHQRVQCQEAILAEKYSAACILMEAAEFEKALQAFEAILSYRDSAAQLDVCKVALLEQKYNAAMQLMEEKRFQEAGDIFAAISPYQDSAIWLEVCKTHLQTQKDQDDAPESDFEIVDVQGGCAITKYTGPGGVVRIPPAVGGKAVVAICKGAFWNCGKLKEVHIPEGVAELGP